MWFVEQFDSFLNLGICKEYPNMARSKSTSGGKTIRKKNGSDAINLVPVNLVPINLEDEIRRRAYELYQQRGPASGSEAEDWLTAEREVRQRYRQQSA
jgi:Protein of unknown function (DUF2934)